ncbi:MAG TPA: hypothetical protein VJX29_02945 [Candidatus Acidoferrales bacterium]|nr:hypothetical protein [Candidatus Acidoferrales bacterium]
MKEFSNTWVPPAMKVQLARLFGSASPEVTREMKSPEQWRRILQRVLLELDRYLSANVETDAVHRVMLHSGLHAANESLKRQDFWPGYVEGITRLALLLMGDYPDHRKRRRGQRPGERYRLSRLREVHFTQTPAQKLMTLMAAPLVGIQLKKTPGRALAEFRRQFGSKPSPEKFFTWYCQHYPEDYAAIF